MKIISHLEHLKAAAPTAVTIGKFDGLHRGHLELIRETVRFAREETARGRETRSAVIALSSGAKTLLTASRRRELLAALGVEIFADLPVDKSFMDMTAEAFMSRILAERLSCRQITVGEDFRFGRGRAGDGELLKSCGRGLGFQTVIIPEVYWEGEIISSTRIRDAVAAGRMEEAAAMLGYSYELTGKVVHGRRLGRTIGVPTANLVPPKDQVLPPFGVYYSEVLVDGNAVAGMSNLGCKPTVGGSAVGLETKLLDFAGDLYGRELTVRLLHFQRKEKRFADLAALRDQLQRDESGARAYFLKRPCGGGFFGGIPGEEHAPSEAQTGA